LTENDGFKGVMVYIEHTNRQIETVSLEILGKANDLARKLNTNVTALVLGNGVRELAEESIFYGADKAILAESPALQQYNTDTYCNAVASIVSERKPEILLFGATHDGRDLAGRLAVRLATGLTAHAVQAEIEEGTNLLVCGVPGFGGSIVAMCKCPHSRPQMATVRPGIFQIPKKDQQRKGIIEEVHPKLGDPRTKILERSVKPGVDITKAEILVVAGRGAEPHLDSVRKLAESIGAAIGVTRPLADKGLMPRDHQVGSTGCAVAPKVAIVLGASGAAHFVSGIREAEVVISVNKDPNAPIGSFTDYAFVEDLAVFLPALLSKTKPTEVAA